MGALTAIFAGKKGASIMVLIAALASAAAVYMWQEWTIADLETQLQRKEREVSACKANVKEFSSAIQERNKEIDRLQEQARKAEKRGQKESNAILDRHQESRGRIKEGEDHGPEVMNQWLNEQFSSP